MIISTELKINTTEAKKIVDSKANISRNELVSKVTKFSNVQDKSIKVIRPWQKKVLYYRRKFTNYTIRNL